jgi:hypothetical protein
LIKIENFDLMTMKVGLPFRISWSSVVGLWLQSLHTGVSLASRLLTFRFDSWCIFDSLTPSLNNAKTPTETSTVQANRIPLIRTKYAWKTACRQRLAARSKVYIYALWRCVTVSGCSIVLQPAREACPLFFSPLLFLYLRCLRRLRVESLSGSILLAAFCVLSFETIEN